MTLLSKSLRKLVLIGLGEEVLVQVGDLPAIRSVLAPHLKGINLSYFDRRPNPGDLEMKGEGTEYVSYGKEYVGQLRKDCKAGGIQLGISPGPKEAGTRGYTRHINKFEYWVAHILARLSDFSPSFLNNPRSRPF
jgi:hypothetical protein